MDYKPIILHVNQDNKYKINKKYLYKNGHLIITNRNEGIVEVDHFCILDVYKQRMRCYLSEKSTEYFIIGLKGAKVEESKNNEFFISKPNEIYTLRISDT